MEGRTCRDEYRHSRQKADKAAIDWAYGIKVKGYRHKRAWLPSNPEPPRVEVEGAEWVARLYEMVACDADTCAVLYGPLWQDIADSCRCLESQYIQEAVKDRHR